MMVQLAAAPVRDRPSGTRGRAAYGACLRPWASSQAHPVPAPCCGPACSPSYPLGDSTLCLRDTCWRQRSIVSCVSWRRRFTSP